MRIGIFTQNNRKGGLDTFIVNLINYWPNDDDEIVLFCNALHPGIETIKSCIRRNYTFVTYVPVTQKIIEFSNRNGLFLKYCSKLFYAILGFPTLIISLGRIIKSQNLERFMVVNGGYPGGDACRAASIAWGLIKPTILSWHNYHNFAISPVDYKSRAQMVFDYLIDWGMSWHVKGFVTVSNACSASMKQRQALLNLPVKVIYNGVEEPLISGETNLRQELGLFEETKLLLMLAVYEERKGHEFIIQVLCNYLEQYEEVHLVICGFGSADEVNRVQKMVDDAGISQYIHLMNFRNDVGDLLSQCNLLVIPSQEFESFGYIAVEAMACGVPIVSTDTGGLPEVLDNGNVGLVSNIQDVMLFCYNIQTLLNDSEKQKLHIANGYSRYKDKFLPAMMSKNYMDLIK